MHDKTFILKSFGLFFNYNSRKLILLFLMTLVTGFSQGITILLLIPLLGLLQPENQNEMGSGWLNFLNEVIGNTGLHTSLGLILGVFAMCLVSVTILNYFTFIIQYNYQQEFSYFIRKRLFRKIISSDWEFLNGKSKHNHIQAVTTEVPKMANYYYYYLNLTNKVVLMMTYILLATLVSVKFTIIVVGVGVVVFVLLGKYLKKADLLGNAGIQSFRTMLKRIDDFWSTIKIAKVHNSEKFYYQKFEENNNQMLEIQNKQIRNRAVPQLLFSIAGLISMVIFVYIAYSLLKIPMVSIFVLILLFSRIFPQFASMNNDLNMMITGTASVRMILEIDKEICEHDFNEQKNANTIIVRKGVELQNISFAYDSAHPIFSNFSAFIPANKITGILGTSGKGKTTLIDIISGLLKTPEGSIYVDGIKISETGLPSWKNGIGYLPQDSFFIDGTIRENLLWDTRGEIEDKQILEILRLVNAEDLVVKKPKGLDTFIHNYTYHFSGGERQRLALARVILRKPTLLLLDEATSSLDIENEELIMNYLSKLKREMTIVFITHKSGLKEYFDNSIDLD